MSKILNIFFVFSLFVTVRQFKITQAFRVFDLDGEETILALPNEDINIECKTDMPIAYCVFIHPSGKRFSVSGPQLNIGHCIRTIKAAFNDTGLWRCHIGRTGTRVEIIQNIYVRVVDHVAAVQNYITAVHGKPVTMSCATVKGLIPLSYCRFEPPNGQSFSIDAEVTAEKPILNRYHFPSNKSLDRGDCAVTIRKVKYEDAGIWICGAGLDDGQEHIDAIKIHVEGIYSMSTASATGITFGAIAVILLLAVLGVVAWKKRSMLGSRPQEIADAHELEQLPTSCERTPSGRSIPQVTVDSPSEPEMDTSTH